MGEDRFEKTRVDPPDIGGMHDHLEYENGQWYEIVPRNRVVITRDGEGDPTGYYVETPLMREHQQQIIDGYPDMVRVLGEDRAREEVTHVIGELINRGIFTHSSAREVCRQLWTQIQDAE